MPPRASQRAPERVGVRHLNDALIRAYKRADELEERFVGVLEPILARAGTLAAESFRERVTEHLTAAVLTGADVKPRSAMVALYPRADEAAALAEDGGEAPESMHVTLAFLGEIDQDTEEAVAAALGPVAASHPQLAGTAGGAGIFTDKGNGMPAIVLPDVPGLVELRQHVCDALIEAGAEYSRDHGYQPHLTVAYRKSGDATPPDHQTMGGELHFDALCLVVGNERVAEYPLTGVRALTAAAWTPPAGDEIVNVDALVAELRTKTDPVRLALIRQAMTPALEAAGLSFDVTNPFTQSVLAQSGSQITSIAETTQLNVMRIVRASYEQGLSVPDTATAIQGGMRDAAFTRATLIARTEMAGAVNGGSLAATQIVAGETGMALKKTWLTAEGAMYPRHEDYDGLDGQTVELNGVFQVGGDELQFPGDPSGSPEEVCNCRCTLVYVEGDTEADAPEGAPDAGE